MGDPRYIIGRGYKTTIKSPDGQTLYYRSVKCRKCRESLGGVRMRGSRYSTVTIDGRELAWVVFIDDGAKILYRIHACHKGCAPAFMPGLLRSMRESSGFSVEEASKAIGTCPRTIANVEHRGTSDHHLVMRMCQEYGVPRSVAYSGSSE